MSHSQFTSQATSPLVCGAPVERAGTQSAALVDGFNGLFSSPEEYAAFKRDFKGAAHARQLSAADMLLHATLMGKDPRRSFGLVTNPVKLANGQRPLQGLQGAAGHLAYRGAGRFAASLHEDTVKAAKASVAALMLTLRSAA